MRKRNNPVRLAALLALAGMASACSEFLPEELDSFDKDVAFSQTLYRPTLGRTTVFSNNFNAGNSTRPLTFTILDVRHADGTPAPELTEYYPVQVWQTPYLGTERSVAEIEAKRTTENRPLLQVRQHSGEIVVRSEARSEFVRVDPDEGYEFDVRAENSGGFKDFAGLRLITLPTRFTDAKGERAHVVFAYDRVVRGRAASHRLHDPRLLNLHLRALGDTLRLHRRNAGV